MAPPQNWLREEFKTLREDFNARLDALEQGVTRMRQQLFEGNGKPSMTTRLERVEIRCEECVSRKKSVKSRVWRLFELVAAALLGAFATRYKG